MWGFETHAGGEYNHLRLGAPSQIAQAAKVTALPGVIGAYRGNHTADFTVDEFYVWKNEVDAGNPLVTWLLGRVTERPFSEIFTAMALHGVHFQPFQSGIVHLRDVVYYGAVTYVFLFASTRVLEARRWR